MTKKLLRWKRAAVPLGTAVLLALLVLSLAPATSTAQDGPQIRVEKSANPHEVQEPGGQVTYQVKVRNEGSEAVTVTQMHDNVYGDLIVGANSLVSSTTCDLDTIQPGETYKCEFEAEAVGESGDTVSDTVQVRVKDEAGKKAEASAQAAVTITGGPKPVVQIRVEKTANPQEVQEPGDTVTYQIKVRNEGSEPVTVTQMQDNVYGDLIVGANSLVSSTTCDLVTIKAGETYKCEFDAQAVGKSGDKVSDKVQVRVKDAAGGKAEASAEATVTITGGPKPVVQIRVEKTANPQEVQEPGDTVTYQIKVRNEGSEPVTVTQMHDNLYGDLIVGANSLASSTTCDLVTIKAGETYKCEFDAKAVGKSGDKVSDKVQVRVKDAAGGKAEASAEATVTITGGPKPVVQIRVEKTANPQEVQEPGDTVTYQIKVRNEGSEPVTVTQMHDNVYGDLIVGANSLVSYTTCELETIQPGGTYKCEFEAEAMGKSGDKVRDKVQVRVKDAAGAKGEASAEATVTITGGPKPVLQIRVEKTANPQEVQEPGDTVTYHVKVRNEGSESVTVTQMHDNVYGDLIVGASSLVGYTSCDLVTIHAGQTYNCEFDADVFGSAGTWVSDKVQVRVKDAAGNKAEASAEATVAISGGSKPMLLIRVEKSASPTEVLEPGEVVTYHVKVRNEGTESVTVTQMYDNLYGDLIVADDPLVGYSSCDLVTIHAGETYKCEFDADVYGDAGTWVSDTVLVRVKDAAGYKAEVSAEATVKIVSEVPDTGVPLPPPVIAGALLALGAAAMAGGALVQGRGRRAG